MLKEKIIMKISDTIKQNEKEFLELPSKKWLQCDSLSPQAWESIKDHLHQSQLRLISAFKEMVEELKKNEMSASEGCEFELSKDYNINANRWSRLQGAHKPEWIAAEIYNQAIDDLLSSLTEDK